MLGDYDRILEATHVGKVTSIVPVERTGQRVGCDAFHEEINPEHVHSLRE